MKMSDLKNKKDATSAIEGLVAAFSKHDKEAYFSYFAEDATFLFHNQDKLLHTKAEYKSEWTKWEDEDQFRVLECRSSNQNLQLLDDIAIFTHWVTTTISTVAGSETSHERETIVMKLNSLGQWLAVHEHLSVPSS
jgi:ketosteroid isomerase-like protein